LVLTLLGLGIYPRPVLDRALVADPAALALLDSTEGGEQAGDAQ